jgi:hypothetical protein
LLWSVGEFKRAKNLWEVSSCTKNDTIGGNFGLDPLSTPQLRKFDGLSTETYYLLWKKSDPAPDRVSGWWYRRHARMFTGRTDVAAATTTTTMVVGRGRMVTILIYDTTINCEQMVGRFTWSHQPFIMTNPYSSHTLSGYFCTTCNFRTVQGCCQYDHHCLLFPSSAGRIH